ncbi:EF-hand domain-containing family member C2 [Nasonia vitripennis]|uniref:EF-hand domain-containing family member C2 n=1 Tax=Nasonia vitripennis TaxID=7425 RepID=A0A7M7G5C4_NASVI|nr:EF-hand domain-containing family member C2 [Nasonia vitripennis]
MHQIPQLPRLPGFNFDHNIGRTRFHRSQLFDRIHGDVYYLAEKPKSSKHSRYPAIYAWGEEPPSPPWLALDGQRLMFKAYFQESVHERREPYRIRLVDISFFLEDGTMKISEPAVDNSGLEQGVLVRRQRIPLPDPVKYRYFDILDLNIGKEPQIYGRVYKIIDCDKFTRRFLNRMGIPVPDPLPAPADPTYERQKSATVSEKSHQKKPDSLGNFLKFDRKVLRFFGYWDDSDSPYGYVHDLEILYYLADDTIEILENLPTNCGPSSKSTLVKRLKIPKFFTSLEPVGSSDPLTILNVLGESTTRSYYIADNSYCKKSSADYYKECDLTIGAQINIFGRKVVITDLDNFTKEYYRNKYGLDDFTPLDQPGKRREQSKNPVKYVPPYNGFGSYEDSLVNCFSMVPKRPKVITDKFYQYDNQENDNRILRFGCKMISDIPDNTDRCFVISVYLLDNTVAVFEVGAKKAGHTKSLFQKRTRLRLPGQNMFSSEEPKYYEPQDFFVGTTVNLQGFRFQIETADERTFNYMEQHCNEFPKANVKFIMDKVRDHLKSVYREFIGEYSPLKNDDHPPVLRLSCLREALYNYLGDHITEHEVMTVARHYSFREHKEVCPREYVRALVHTELTRHVWNELDRLEEDIREWDRERIGYLNRNQLYTILRASRIPLQKELINLMLDRLHKNEQGKLDYQDLLKFVNIAVDPLPPMPPINVKELYWTTEETPKSCRDIDWCLFLKDLGLEQQLKELGSPTNDK